MIKKTILFSVQDINIGDSIKLNIEKVLKEKFEKVIYIKDEFNGQDKTVKYKCFREILKKINEKNYLKKKFRKYENTLKLKEAAKYQDINYFLVISGGKFSKTFIERLKEKNPKIKTILFLWDKLEYSYWRDKVTNFDYVFSYDRIEALKNNFIFRPTFFIDRCLENIPKEKKYNLYYIGALKEEKRYMFLTQLKKYFEDKKLENYIKLYAGRKTIKKLKKDKKNYDEELIISKRISYEENLEILKQSNVVLDIKYKDQNGLSLRIYEALATDTKIITDSKDVVSYDFYNENNIKIIENISDIEKLELDFFKLPVEKINEKIKEYYSVKGFVEDIFSKLN